MPDETYHDSNVDAKNHFMESFEKATLEDDGRWMGALWRVKDGKIQLIQLTTHKFPKGDFLAAVAHLSNSLFERIKEVGLTLPTNPLPPPPQFNLVDGDGEDRKPTVALNPYEEKDPEDGAEGRGPDGE